MPVTIPKPRQEFEPATNSNAEIDQQKDKTIKDPTTLNRFHSGLFGFLFEPQNQTDRNYKADKRNIQFDSSGWAYGAEGNGGFPLRSIIGDTDQLLELEKLQGKRHCSSLPKGIPSQPQTWFTVSLPPHIPHFNPTHYALRHGRNSVFGAMRSWNLLGSRDGGRWYLLSKHTDENVLEGPFFTGMFKLYAENVSDNRSAVECCLPHCNEFVGPIKAHGALDEEDDKKKTFSYLGKNESIDKQQMDNEESLFASHRKSSVTNINTSNHWLMPSEFYMPEDLLLARHARCNKHENVCLVYPCQRSRWHPSNYCIIHGMFS